MLQTVDQLRSVPAARSAEDIALSVHLSHEATAGLHAKLRDAPLRILLVDDDDHLPEFILEAAAEVPVKVVRTHAHAAIERELTASRAQIVLLDLSIDEPAGSARVDTALALLDRLRRTDATVPVFLFSENPENRDAFDAVVARVIRNGGARGYLPFRRPSANPLSSDDFAARLYAILAERSRELLLRTALREHKSMAWQTVVRWQGDGKASIELARVQEAAAYSAADQTGPIRFTGVPAQTFDDVIGLVRAKKRLGEVALWLSRPSTLGDFGVQPPRGFLLSGPPGTGKTLLARAFAGEARLPMLALSAGELQSKYVGESEERIRDLFAMARKYAPSIVFIDEIDGIARQRNDQSRGFEVSALNQLLASMDGFAVDGAPVFVLAATNHPDALDPAIRRPGRFDETLVIDLPNAGERTAFFVQRLRKVPTAADVDVARLVPGTSGASPAELDRMVREAIYAAAGAGRGHVTASDLETARRTVRYGADKHGTASPRDELERTAWHEAGHALVQLTLFPQDRIDHISIVANERGALGFMASSRDEERHDLSIEDVRGRIAVALAGRLAEQSAPGSGLLTAGAASDLRYATQLAFSAVTRWGFDPTFGQVSLDGLVGPDRESLAGLAAERLREWLDRGEAAARQILDARKADLAALAGTLLERERLDAEDVVRVMGRGRQASMTLVGDPRDGN